MRTVARSILICVALLVLMQSAMAQPPGRPRRKGPPRGERATIENPLQAKDDVEAKAIEAIEKAQQGPRFANVSNDDGRLLRLLTETMNAQQVVEIGTSTGESGIWFAMALKKTGGKLITHDIDPERAKVAAENFKRAGVDDVITLVLGDAHETVTKIEGPIDILFLDADKAGYIDYLQKLLPKVRAGGLIIAHNMVYPTPDPDYLKAITKDPNLETSFLLMEGAGLGVTLKKR